jgi:hypothetical protein
MQSPPKCPRCQSDEVLPIRYGRPTTETVEESLAGRVALGGECFGLRLPTGSARYAATSGARRRLGSRNAPVLCCTACLMYSRATSPLFHMKRIIPARALLPRQRFCRPRTVA